MQQNDSLVNGAGRAGGVRIEVAIRTYDALGAVTFDVTLPDGANGTQRAAFNTSIVTDGGGSRWRDCHFTDTPSPSLLKHLLKVEGGAAAE